MDARRESHKSQRTKTTNTTNNNHSISWHSSSIWIVTLYMYAPRIQIIYGNLEIFLHSIGVFLICASKWSSTMESMIRLSPPPFAYLSSRGNVLFVLLWIQSLWFVSISTTKKPMDCFKSFPHSANPMIYFSLLRSMLSDVSSSYEHFLAFM